jgi:hypothetical protein
MVIWPGIVGVHTNHHTKTISHPIKGHALLGHCANHILGKYMGQEHIINYLYSIVK